MIEQTVPSFPIYVTVPASAAVLVLALIEARRLHEACATFLLLATWFRYSIATFHQYTYPPLVFGLSLIALTSILMVAIGLVVVGRRSLLLRGLVPIYALMVVILLSATINQSWVGAINGMFKWLYLIVFATAAYHAMCRRGPDRVFRSLAVIFIGPIGLQWLSVPWGLKTTSEDGWSFYIGGYQHQQSISIIFITYLYVTCFSPSLGMVAAALRVAIVAAGLTLANYRTAALAAALPTATLVITKLKRKVVPQQRRVTVIALAGVAVLVFIGVAGLARERFADIGTTLDKGALLIKPPEHFTTEDKRLFSGRLYLWSQYIDAYLGGDILNSLVGFGPESWVGRFTTYAHNTFVSYLYELGLFGLGAFVWLLASGFLAAARVSADGRGMLVSCHAGFVVLNLSTMAIWTLEGAILYGLLLGQTWYLQSIKSEVGNSRLRGFAYA